MTAVASVERCLKQLIEKEDCMAGASVLVRRGGREALYAQAGYADREAGLPLTRENIFRLYSQTKPVTAAAAMLLVERGLLDLMEPVETFLPGFRHQRVAAGGTLTPAKRPVVVMDLLGMSAGITYGGEDAAGRAASELVRELNARQATDQPMTTVELANRIGELPLAFQPGTRMRYSFCADVLGAVIEVLDGRPFSRFLREELFEPLVMKDTGFFIPEEKLLRLCACYERTPDGLRPVSPVNGGVRDTCREPTFASGGGGLYSTIDDYMAFAAMLLAEGVWQGKRILSPESVRFLASAQHPYAEEFRPWHGYEGYAYGKLMRQGVRPGEAPMFVRPGEYGWDGWLGVYFANFPVEQMTILMMMQIKDTGTSRMQRRLRNVILALESQGEL